MRRLKSIAPGSSSASDNLGDSNIKRGNFEQEDLERQASQGNFEKALTSSANWHMASVSAAPLSATKVGGTSTSAVGVTGLKPTASAVEQLPKEMNEMKLRDDRADNNEDKVHTFGIMSLQVDASLHDCFLSRRGENARVRDCLDVMTWKRHASRVGNVR